jgi:MFS family permease
MGLQPDGDGHEDRVFNSAQPPEAGVVSAGERTWTLREAIQTRALWLVLLTFTLGNLATAGIMIHYVPYIESLGFSPGIAATAMTLFALCCAVVKIPWGLAAERVPARYCVIAVFLGCAAGVAILMNANIVATIYWATIVYGLAMGGIIVLMELVWANYFGRTFLGTIRGVVMPAAVISMAGGPLFAARLYDLTDSYHIPFSFFIAVLVAGAFTMSLAKPPKPPENEVGSG